MEYTKDMIFNLKYRSNKVKSIAKEKKSIAKRFVRWLEKDDYFVAVILTSIVVLIIDFFVVKKFIEILASTLV